LRYKYSKIERKNSMQENWASKNSDQFRPAAISEQILGQLGGPMGKSLRDMKSAFDAARQELKLVNPDPRRLTEIQVAAIEAAREDLKAIVAQERAAVEHVLEAQRKAFERDADLNLDKYTKLAENYERRTSAMGPGELETEMTSVLNGSKQLRPEQLDILSRELKASDPSLHKLFRDEIAKRDLYSTWRHTPEGVGIVRYLETVKAAEQHGGEVPVKTPDGQCWNVMLDSVLGGSLEGSV
jgi:hypothetical protein